MAQIPDLQPCRNCGYEIHRGISGNVPGWFHEDGIGTCPDERGKVPHNHAQPSITECTNCKGLIEYRFMAIPRDVRRWEHFKQQADGTGKEYRWPCELYAEPKE